MANTPLPASLAKELVTVKVAFGEFDTLASRIERSYAKLTLLLLQHYKCLGSKEVLSCKKSFSQRWKDLM